MGDEKLAEVKTVYDLLGSNVKTMIKDMQKRIYLHLFTDTVILLF